MLTHCCCSGPSLAKQLLGSRKEGPAVAWEHPKQTQGLSLKVTCSDGSFLAESLPPPFKTGQFKPFEAGGGGGEGANLGSAANTKDGLGCRPGGK